MSCYRHQTHLCRVVSRLWIKPCLPLNTPPNSNLTPDPFSLLLHRLQVPIGGGSMDPSFPRAASPRSRACPARLKALLGGGSSYEEGIDFVAKVSKLLVFNIGIGSGSGKSSSGGNDSGKDESQQSTAESQSSQPYSAGTKDLLRLFTFLKPYFNPSNVGRCTYCLGAFRYNFSY